MNDPFARLPVVPSFAVTGTDVTDGQELPPEQMSGLFGVPGGKDLSPQLSWSGAPVETKSYTVTMYEGMRCRSRHRSGRSGGRS